MEKTEILNYFMNENISLVEVKRDKEVSWISFKDNNINKLDLTKSFVEDVNGNNIEVREFSNGEFRFDQSFGKCLIEDDGHLIMSVPAEQIPTTIVTQLDSLSF